MILDLTRGAGFLMQGFRLINQPGIRRFVIVPLLINLVLFAGAIWYLVTQFEIFMDWLLPTLPAWLAWLQWLIWLLWPLFAIATSLIVFYLFTPVVNLLAAPFNSLLAERLELHLTGQPLPEGRGLKYLLGDAAKAFMSEIKKLSYMLLWAIPLLILFLIPGVNLIAPFLWFLFSAWMLSLEYADYPMANHNMLFRAERELLRKHRPLALGFGSAVTLMTTIPVLNFLAMPVGVAGATAMWVERLKDKADATAPAQS